MQISNFAYPLLPQPQREPSLSGRRALPRPEAPQSTAGVPEAGPSPVPNAPGQTDSSHLVQQAQQRKVEAARFRDVYPEHASPQTRKAVDAYSANLPSEVPETLAGIDILA